MIRVHQTYGELMFKFDESLYSILCVADEPLCGRVRASLRGGVAQHRCHV